ncbi:obscurin isoform X2 [Carettochelys insculpta]|uniref:obscurin isoform X2 n=1 Tax=Carettochelys insculpta TaxID=44489 RepID=UPI003EBC1BC7
MDYSSFSGAPRFLTRPKAFMVSVGKDATLSCQIVGNPIPVVSWEKDKLPIQSGGRFKMVEDGDLYRLTIYDLTFEDSGQYICRAKNTIGEAFTAVSIKVGEETTVMESAPYFIQKPSSIRVTLGDDVTFKCKVQGSSPLSVNWAKDGRHVGSGSDSKRFRVESFGESNALKIQCAQLEDSGTYLCRAENPIGSASATATLVVDAHGSYNPSSSCLDAGYGKTASLLSHLQKRREEIRKMDMSTLTAPDPMAASTYSATEGLSGIGLSLSRDYERAASLTAKSARNTTFGVLTRTFNVTEGKHAKLSCYVTGEPKPEIVWKKDGEVITEGRRHIVYEDEQENFVLKILFCKQVDNGLYTCTASNLVGQTYSSVLVTVGEPTVPFKTKLKDVEVQEKESATLQCEVPVPSTETTWFKEETKLQQSKKYNIEEEGTYRRLTIQNVTTDDDAVYICEMKEGSRTIAELTVQGNIIKKLPRKTAVSINDTAIFCVELDNEIQNVRWLKNREEVKPSDRITVTSSGKQHTLIIRECKMEDSGEIAFLADECRTSTQFIVSTPRKPPSDPPFDPVVKNKTETSVTLAWSPPKMEQLIPIDGYLVERKKLTGFTWIRCHQSPVPIPEFTVSDLSEEADYQFRVSAVNNYGQSSYLEFPGTLHLEPALAVKTALTDVEAMAGGDATFIVDLTTACSGTWYLNGKTLQSSETYVIRRTETTHILTIKNITKNDDGAEVKFVAKNAETSAKMRVKAAAVRITNKSGDIEKVSARLHEEAQLWAELSDLAAAVKWLKDGKEIQASPKYELKATEKKRILKIHRVTAEDAGLYECVCEGDKIVYNLSVKALAHFTNKEKAGGVTIAVYGKEAEFVSETSEADVTVQWYKDGKEIRRTKKFALEDNGKRHKLTVSAVTKEDEGMYMCKVGEDTIAFSLKVSDEVKFVNKPKAMPEMSVNSSESLELVCEVSVVSGAVVWKKDQTEVKEDQRTTILSQGTDRKLLIKNVTQHDQGRYTCESKDDKITFQVKVKEREEVFANQEKVQREVKAVLTESATLSCEVAQAKTDVKWYKDGKLITSSKKFKVESEGKSRHLVLQQVEMKDAGEYTCEAAGQKLTFKLTITEVEEVFANQAKVQREVKAALTESATLSCEVAQAKTDVKWYKDGRLIIPSKKFKVESEGKCRRLVVEEVEKKDAGEYICEAVGQKLTFRVVITEAEEVFANQEKVQREVKAVLTESATLNCEVAQAKTDVKWYKDGKLITSSKQFKVESEGKSRRLVVNQVEKKDAGEYTCEAAGQKLTFKLTIPETERVFANQEKVQREVKAVLTESATLSCEVAQAKTDVKWYKDGRLISPSKKFKVESEGKSRRLVVEQVEKKDSGEYTCEAAGQKLTFKIIVTEADEVFANQEKVQREVKAVLTESASFSCEVAQAKTVVKWYKDGRLITSSKKFKVESEGKSRQLVIGQVEKKDAGEYTCEAAGQKLTFKLIATEPEVVFANQEKVQREVKAVLTESATLSCEVAQAKTDVKWYKDGKLITSSKQFKVESEGKSRRLVVNQVEKKDAGEYTCEAAGQKLTFQVIISEPEIVFANQAKVQREVKAVLTESATLSCEVAQAKTDVKWYKDGKLITSSKKLKVEADGKSRRLVVEQVDKKDAGEYTCEATGQKLTFKMNVTEPESAFANQAKVQREVKAVLTESATLSCEVAQAKTDVKWYKDGKLITPSNKLKLEAKGKSRQLVFQQMERKDAGEYTCEAAGQKLTFKVEAVEPEPKFQKKPIQKEPIIVQECESITLTTSVMPETAVVKWFKDGAEIKGSKKYEMKSDGALRTLTVKLAEGKDSAVYTCETMSDKQEFKVQVTEVPVKFAKKLEAVNAEIGGTISLTCELSQAQGDVRWYKNGAEVKPSKHFQIREDGVKRILTIMGLRTEDGGEYSCESRDDKSSIQVTPKAPRVVKFTTGLHNMVSEEGKEATFKCVISPNNAVMTWHRNGVKIEASKKYVISQKGTSHSLTITDLTLEDAAEISANAEGVESKASLTVREAPVTFTKKLEPKTVEERGTVTLEVELSKPSTEVKWMRNSIVLQPSSNMEIKAEGTKHNLTIKNITFADRGFYCCETLEDKTQAKLNVEMRKVKLVKGLQPLEVHEKETGTFELELSHEDVEGSWMKDGLKLKPGENCHMSVLGKKHSLTLSSLKLEDSGLISFKAEGIHSSGRLVVTELPVKISKPLVDIKAPEKDKVTFECELSRPNAEVKWFKNGSVLRPSKKVTIISQETKRSLIIHKCDYNDQGTYVCDAGDATSSATLAVHARDIKIIKPLEDVEVNEKESASFTCEISHDEVQTQWFKNDNKLKAGDNIKMRQEGKAYALIYKSVCVEDAAEIKFVAEKAESRAQLRVKELPVKIVRPLRDKIAIERHRGILECQVSRPSAKVKWYKKNVEILPSQKYELVSDGVYRKLIINDAEFQDEDIYTCDAVDDTSSAHFYVEEQSINIVKELNDMDVTEPAEAKFECELSIPSVKPPKWSLGGEVLQPGRNVTIEQEGTIHRLILWKTTSDMTGTIQFAIGKSKSTANLLVRDIDVQITRRLEDKTALEHHSVILSCDFKPSPKVVEWFKDHTLIEPSEKYKLKWEMHTAELKILKLTPEDSGTYKCRAGNAETKARLTVEARQVVITKHLQDVETEEDSCAIFSCELSHEDEDVEWLLNDTVLYSNSCNEIKKVGKCHTLMLKQVTPDDAGTVTIKTEKVSESAQLKVKEKPVVFLKALDDVVGEECGVITLECEVSKPKVNPIWKKDDVEIILGDKYEQLQAGKTLCLSVHDLDKNDAGLYTCDIGTDLAKSRVSIQELNIGITKRLKNTEVQEGENCTFECILSHESIGNFHWMLKGKEVENGGRFKIFNTGRKYTLSIRNVTAADAGEVAFSTRNLSSKASLVVKEKPAEIVKQLEDKTSTAGQDARLTCEMSKPDVNVKWYKDGKAIRKSQKYDLRQEGTWAILVIHDATTKDSGEYMCETETYKTKALLTVQDKPNRFAKELSDLKADEKGVAVFMCQTEKTAPAVTWRKGMIELKTSHKYEITQKGNILQLTVNAVEKSDSDTYTCDIGEAQTRAKLTVQGQKVLITEDLEDVDVIEGDSAMFRCRISPIDYSNVQWFLDKTPLHTNELNDIQSKPGGYHLLTLKKLSLKDSGVITFEAGDKKTSASLVVKEKPCIITKELADAELFEGEDAFLHCETSKSDSPVKWYKDGKTLRNSSKYKISRSGFEATLVIHGTEERDSGRYECEAGAAKTSAVVTVKALPVLFKRELQSEEAKEGSQVKLICELSKPNVPVKWTKGDTVLLPGDKYQLKQRGTVAELIIQDVKLIDDGDYTCSTGEQKTTARVKVKALPILFKQNLQDTELEEGSTVALRCEITKPDARVVWKKGGTILQENDKYEMRQKGSVAELFIHNAEPEDAGRYSCDTGDQQTMAQVKIHARPALIKEELKDLEATEGGTAILRCELNKAAPVEWKKGSKELRPSGKYRMRQEGTTAELIIHDLELKDAGGYTCVFGDKKTTAALTVNALPVRFKKELKNEEATESGTATLHCELTKAVDSVEWMKDQKLLKPSGKYRMRQEGRFAELIIQDLTLADAGDYTCVCGDQKTTAALTVNALPPIFQEELNHKEVSEGGTVTLHCKLSKSAPVEWKKGQRALRPSEKYKIRQDGPAAELVIHDLDMADAGDYTCVCGKQQTTATLTVNALPTRFTKELKNQEAMEGENATLCCELNKAALTVEWKKGHKTLKPSDKYKMRREGCAAELIIQDLSMTDAGNYACVCGDQQTMASLTVNVLPAFFKEGLKNREATEGGTATLHCELTKVPVVVEWKKGQRMLKPSDKYRMRQEGPIVELLIRDLDVEDTDDYTCVCGDQKTSAVLTVHALPALFKKELKNEEATESGTATFRCELTKGAPVEWMKAQTVLTASDKYKMRQKDATVELLIHDLDEQDAGDYTCMCGDQKTTASLTVHVLPPHFKKELKNLEAMEGEVAILHCELTKAAAPVEWKKGLEVLKPSNKFQITQEGAIAELVIQDLDLTDAGDYTCMYGDQKTTAALTVNALPARFKEEMKNEEATEGGIATLRCQLTKVASVEWKKKHKVLKPSDKYTIRQEGAIAELVIHDVEVKDSGDYTCVCGDQKTTAALTIHALPALFKEHLRNEEATEGGAVTLHCELTKAAPVEWKKGHKVLKPSDKYKMRQKDTTAELEIHTLDVSDAGDYTCVCGDRQSTAALAVHALPAFIREELQSEEAREGGTATLRCALTKPAPVEWMKGDSLLKASDKYKMRQEGPVVKLVIHDLELKDAGDYTCMCGDQKTTAGLTVHALPALFKKELKNLEATEGKTATLRCELSKPASVGWKKGHKVLQASDKYSLRQDGVTAELEIHDLALQDAGDYTCTCGDRETTATLVVNALPVLFKGELKNEEVTEGGSVTLRCELTKTAAVEWQRGQDMLKASAKYKMRQQGTTAELVIHDVGLEDAGDYTCVSGEQKTTAALTVHALPVLFKEELRNKEATEGGSATLYCELTKAAPVEWKKGHQVLKASEKYQMRLEGAVAELVICNLSLKDMGDYMCVCGDQQTTATLTVNAMPARFKEQLKNEDAKEGGSATLRCELTKAAPVEWKKGHKALKASEKYQMKLEGTIAELMVHDLVETDTGGYTCVCGEHQTTAALTVHALPPSFKEEMCNQEAIEGGTTTLRCELTKAAPVEWKKGHKMLRPNNKYTMRQEGCIVELIVHCLDLKDTGDYTCVCGDQKTTATLTVHALPPRFKEELKNCEAMENGAATLRCELTKPAPVEWKKGHKVVKASEKYQMRLEGTIAEMVICPLEVKDAGDYTCVCGDQQTTATLTVNALPALFKHELQDEEAEEDGTVTLRCELTKPNVPVEWRKGVTTLFPGLKYEMKQQGPVVELVIHDLKLEDTGKYTCDSGDQQTTSAVTIHALPIVFKQPLQNQEAEEGGTATLRCEVSKPNIPVEWRRGGLGLQPSNKYEMRQRECIVELLVHNLSLEDTGEYSCDTGNQETKASLYVKALPVLFKKELKDTEVEEGATVKLQCELTKAMASVEWRKGTMVLFPCAKYEMRSEGLRAELVIHNTEQEDTSDYTCDTGDEQSTANLRVNAIKPQFKQQLKNEEVEEGGMVKLCCEVTIANAVVEWRKDGKELQPSSKYEMRQKGTIHELSIQHLEAKDSGKYSCIAGDETTSAVLTVKEPDVTIVSGLTNVVVFEEEDAVFQCTVSHDNAKDVEWKLEGVALQSNEMNEISVEKGKIHTLRLRTVTQQDTGTITFRVGPYVSTAELTVKVPLPVFKETLKNTELEEDGTAVLECEVSQPNVSVEWRKGCQVISPSSKYEIRQEKTIHTLKIYDLKPEDSGKYTCDNGNQETTATLTVRATPALFAQKLQSQEAEEGSTATLRAELSKPHAAVKWRKGSILLHASAKYEMRQKGSTVELLIHDLQLKDAGDYTCDSGDEQTTASLLVKALPVLFIQPLQSQQAEEGGTVTLSCEVSKPSAPVQWKKAGKVLQPSDKYQMKQAGSVTELTIHNLNETDMGEYSCDTGDQQTTAALYVKEPAASIVEGLQNITLYEGEDAVFKCKVSREKAQDVHWGLGGVPLQPNEMNEITAQGKLHTLTLRRVTLEDSGSVSFRVGQHTSEARLTVQVAPAIFVKLLENQELQESDTAKLYCELSKPNIPVEWKKASAVIKASKKFEIKEEGNVHTLIIHDLKLEDSGEYSCKTADKKTTARLDIKALPVLFKRWLQNEEVEEGCTAALRCELTKPDAPVEWRKGNVVLQSSDKYELRQEGTFVELFIYDVGLQDAGEYTCDSGDQQTTAALLVKAVPVLFKEELHNVEVEERGTAVLQCEISKPDAPVEWRKGGLVLQPSDKYEMRQNGTTVELIIHDLEVEDCGPYTCSTGYELTTSSVYVQEEEAEIVCGLKNTDVFAGESATFTCELSRPGVQNVQWWLDGSPLQKSSVNEIAVRDGKIHTLTLKSLGADDSGIVTFRAGPLISSAKLLIKDPTIEVVSPMQDITVDEDGTAVFICQYSRPVQATWKKNEQEVSADGRRVIIEQDWNVAMLKITPALPEDSGIYSCEAGSTKVVALLDVQAKNSIIKGLENVEAMEGGEALFECYLAKPECYNYNWLIDDEPARTTENIEMVFFENGRRHLLLLKNLTPQDNCRVTFLASDAVTSAFLTVKGWRLEILQPLVDLEVTAGDQATLCCVLSEAVPISEVAWYINDVDIQPDENWEIQADGDSYKLILKKAQPHHSGEVTFAARDAITSATLSVIEPPFTVTHPLEAKSILEGNVALLECEFSRETREAIWVKGKEHIQPGGRYEIKSDGKKQTLIIRAFKPEDQGLYICMVSPDIKSSALLSLEVPTVALPKETAQEARDVTDLEEMVDGQLQPSLPPEAAQEGDLHLLWEALAKKRRMSREPTLDSISEVPEEDDKLQKLKKEEAESHYYSEEYSTCDELTRTGEADFSFTSSDDESRAGTPSLVNYLKKAGKHTVSIGSKVQTVSTTKFWKHWEQSGIETAAPTLPAKQPAEPQIMEDLDDPSMNKAAMKIQAAFKGYKVRKEIKQQECPMFSDTFKDFCGEPGGTLHLECVALSKSDMKVRWLKDDEELSDGRHYHIDNYSDGTCSLIITGLDIEDTGKYTCEASNKFGKVSHSANVVVGAQVADALHKHKLAKRLTDSESESSSGSELDDAFRKAGRRLHKLFKSKVSTEMSDVEEELFVSADEGEVELVDHQTYHEDEHYIYIKFEILAEAKTAAGRFREMFAALGIPVDIDILDQGLKKIELRIGKAAPPGPGQFQPLVKRTPPPLLTSDTELVVSFSLC